MNRFFGLSISLTVPMILMGVTDFKSEAKSLLERGQWKELAAFAQLELRNQPNSVDALLSLGIANGNLGKPQEALVCFDKAKSIVITGMDLAYKLALTSAANDDRAQALSALTNINTMEKSNIWRTGNTGPDTPAPDHIWRLTREPSISKVLGVDKAIDLDFSKIKVLFQPPAPRYPVLALQRRIQGVVIIQVTVDPTGVPISAIAVDGPDVLKRTSENYALLWKFKAPDDTPSNVPYRFKLTMPFRLR